MSLPLPCVVATGNPDKATEIVAVIAEVAGTALETVPVESGGERVGYLLRRPGDRAPLPRPAYRPDVGETGATLEENARIKAVAVAAACGVPAIADDTGLEVDALAGAPGVHTARFAGPDATYADNVAQLLRALDGTPEEQRAARFVTVAIAAWPDGREVVARGEVTGRITTTPHGEAGFGYDPVFAPDEAGGRTFAEMAANEKHAISHRGRAFRALATALSGGTRAGTP
jgi:XTP/dITP diphosphohydrolase